MKDLTPSLRARVGNRGLSLISHHEATDGREMSK